jgi:hypothetical protein
VYTGILLILFKNKISPQNAWQGIWRTFEGGFSIQRTHSKIGALKSLQLPRIFRAIDFFMNCFKSVSDTDLLRQIRFDAESERKSGLAVIHQLREIFKRRLDARLGYPSLHRFCMEELKYSSGSAWRRIKAMEALAELPQLEEKIEAGALTLASVSQVENFCQQKDKSIEEKQAIFKQVEGLSKRETEQVLAKIAPEPKRPDNVRTLDAELTELRVTLSKETIAELELIRDLVAHSLPNASYSGIISYLAKLGIQKLNPGAEKRKYVVRPKNSNRQGAQPAGDPRAPQSNGGKAPQTQNRSGNQEREGFPPGEEMEWLEASFAMDADLGAVPASRFNRDFRLKSITTSLPTALRREVWNRDGGECQYVCAQTGKKCGARARVQPDHITPRAKGGVHLASNLVLKCRRHNLLAAIDEYGWKKMEPYLRA